MTLCHGNRIRQRKGKQLLRELEGAESNEAVDDAPTEAEIRQRAHEIYLSRDGAAGCAEVDWLQAEMELRASKTKARFKTVMDSKGACQPPRGRR